MKNKKSYLLVLPVLLVVAAFMTGASSEKRMLFEYKVKLASANHERELGELGREGWELVAVTLGDFTTFYLKRPVSK